MSQGAGKLLWTVTRLSRSSSSLPATTEHHRHAARSHTHFGHRRRRSVQSCLIRLQLLLWWPLLPQTATSVACRWTTCRCTAKVSTCRLRHRGSRLMAAPPHPAGAAPMRRHLVTLARCSWVLCFWWRASWMCAWWWQGGRPLTRAGLGWTKCCRARRYRRGQRLRHIAHQNHRSNRGISPRAPATLLLLILRVQLVLSFLQT